MPVIPGLALGVAIGNLGADALSGFAPFSIGIDIVGGAFANLVAGFLAWKIGGLKLRHAGTICWALGSLALTGVMIIALGPFISSGSIILFALSLYGLLAYKSRRLEYQVQHELAACDNR